MIKVVERATLSAKLYTAYIMGVSGTHASLQPRHQGGERGVDLRELCCELGSGQKFTEWANAKLSQIVDYHDFILLHNIVKQNGSGGHNRKDYDVSLDCAKNIALMEQTERGQQVWQYFINFEKAVRVSYRNRNRPHGALLKMTPSEFVQHHNTARI